MQNKEPLSYELDIDWKNHNAYCFHEKQQMANTFWSIPR